MAIDDAGKRRPKTPNARLSGGEVHSVPDEPTASRFNLDEHPLHDGEPAEHHFESDAPRRQKMLSSRPR